MEGGKGGGAGNYWPGFVDALTNVVIAMVFVIVVLAIALSFLMQLLTQRMAARIAELEQHQGHATVAPLVSPQHEIPREAMPQEQHPITPARSVAQPRHIEVSGNENGQRPAGGAVAQRDDLLVLDYAPKALTLDSAAAAQLDSAIIALKERLANTAAESRITLIAAGPALELSDNQRAAFLRTMAVRNRLLEQGVPAARIDSRFDFQTAAPRPLIMIRIEETRP